MALYIDNTDIKWSEENKEMPVVSRSPSRYESLCKDKILTRQSLSGICRAGDFWNSFVCFMHYFTYWTLFISRINRAWLYKGHENSGWQLNADLAQLVRYWPEDLEVLFSSQQGWQAKGDSPGTNSGTVWGIRWRYHASPRMDHHAYSEYQWLQVSPCEVLCGRKGRCSDPDKPRHSNPVGPCEGPM